MGFIEIITAVKLGLEVYKAIKGAPDDKKEQVKAKLLNSISEVKLASLKGAESGDYSHLEDVLSR